LAAAGAILNYLEETQKTRLDHIDTLTPHRRAQTLEIDRATARTLEITRTMRDGQREGSLLGVLDRTTTPLGARLLGSWLAHPLTDLARITARHDAVAELIDQPALREYLVEQLRGVYDLERLLARVSTQRASPRD